MKHFIMPAVPVHPGEILEREFLKPMGITQTALAEHLKVTFRRINEICRGKRSITPETALMLAEAFDLTPTFWSNLQMLYELSLAKKNMRKKIAVFKVSKKLKKHKKIKPIAAAS